MLVDFDVIEQQDMDFFFFLLEEASLWIMSKVMVKKP